MHRLFKWLHSNIRFPQKLRFGRPRVEQLSLEQLRIEQLRQRAVGASVRLGGRASIGTLRLSQLRISGAKPREVGKRFLVQWGRVFPGNEEDPTRGVEHESDETAHRSAEPSDGQGEEGPSGSKSGSTAGGPSRAVPPMNSSQHPSLEEFGQIGAHYLLSERLWVRRHVETAALKNLQSAKRRLTIDIELPREPSSAVREGRQNLYFLPVTLLAKRPITSYIDFVDEADRSLSLLTREENASVSLAAVIEAGRRLLKEEPPLPLRRVWAELIERNGLDAALALHIAEDVTTRWYPEIEDRPEYFWFMRALRDLAANSFVWMPLRGHGGERRIVKLRCDVAAGPPRLRPQREKTTEVKAVLDDGQGNPVEHTFVHAEPGDGDPRRIFGRVANRIGNTLGLTAMSVALTSPSIRGSSTYHLQFEAPPGLEVQRLTLLTRLRRRRGASKDGSKALGENDWVVENDWDSAHLYMTGAEVSEMAPAVAELRVGRRGFLSLSVMSGLMIIAMMWAYDAAAPINLADSHPEVAAAVLLVVPVMLLTFVVAPGEHPYASKMLAGVRVCILTLGLLAVADAAAIVAVKPSVWSLHHTWFVYAVAASVFGGVLTLGWLLALRTTRLAWSALNGAWESRAVYSACCVVAGLLIGIALGAGDMDTGSATAVPALGVGIPLVLALACVMLVATQAARESYPPAALCWVSGAAAVVAAGFFLEGAIAGLSWCVAWTILAPLVVIATVALAVYESVHLLGKRTDAGHRAVVGESP